MSVRLLYTETIGYEYLHTIEQKIIDKFLIEKEKEKKKNKHKQPELNLEDFEEEKNLQMT